MKKYFSLGFILILLFGCKDTEDPVIEETKDSLYFKFILDGNEYKSEIKEINLIPGSGNEKETKLLTE